LTEKEEIKEFARETLDEVLGIVKEVAVKEERIVKEEDKGVLYINGMSIIYD
jgi:hypothetical protein